MFKYTISTTIIFLFLILNIMAQTYDLRFNVVNIDATNYDVQIQIKSSSTFKLAASNITFDYNTSAISAPALLSAQNYSGVYGVPLHIYMNMTVTEPNVGIASINITYTNEDDTYAADVPTDWTSVGVVRFNIVNIAQNPNLVFRTSGLSPTTIYKISGTSLTLLSPGDLYSNNDPMPVELTDFSIGVVSNNVELTWKTQTETNNYGFEVERTSASLSMKWEKIGFVKGSGTSNAKKEYSYIDNTITSSNKYYYRLKQIDNDGRYEYTKEVSVSVNRAEKFELSQNYPNPFNPSTTIKFSLPVASYVDLSVYNIIGEKIVTLVNEVMEAGVHESIFSSNSNFEQISSGIYFYRLNCNNEMSITKKMILTK